MREIYYAVLKNSDYKTIIMTSIAETIVSGKAEFINGNFVLKNMVGLNSYEKQILTKIRLNESSRFHFSDYHKWAESLIKECLNKKYLTCFLSMWIWPTNYFKKIIKENMTLFNKNIIKYIETKNIDYLKEIDINFQNIQLPEHKRSIIHKDADMEMLKEVIKKGYHVGMYRAHF